MDIRKTNNSWLNYLTLNEKLDKEFQFFISGESHSNSVLFTQNEDLFLARDICQISYSFCKVNSYLSFSRIFDCKVYSRHKEMKVTKIYRNLKVNSCIAKGNKNNQHI